VSVPDLRDTWRDALDGVLGDLGLERSTDGRSWAGDGVLGEDGEAVLAFDAATDDASGAGLFAKARVWLRREGRRIALLKVALTPRAAQAMEHEVAVLRALGGRVGAYAVPVVRATGTSGDGALWTAQSPVGSRRGTLTPAGLVSFADAMPTEGMPEPPFATAADHALSALRAAPSAAGLETAASAQHGDLIASNVVGGVETRALGARAAVVDWEWATPGGMVGFDACHHYLGGALTRERAHAVRTESGLFAARMVLSRAGLDSRTILAAYLDGMASFYGWCAEQDGRCSDTETVVVNVRALAARVTGGDR